MSTTPECEAGRQLMGVYDCYFDRAKSSELGPEYRSEPGVVLHRCPVT